METTDSNNPKLKFGEGNLFDANWNFDGIIGLFHPYGYCHFDLDFRRFRSERRRNIHVIFYGVDTQTEPILPKSRVNFVIKDMLNQIVEMGCRNIGAFGVDISDGTPEECAEEIFRAINEWLAGNAEKVDCITLVDRNNSYANQFAGK